MKKSKGSVRMHGNDLNFYSERGIPLITQEHELKLDKNGNYIKLPFLTVENHNKWYAVYIVTEYDVVIKTTYGNKENKIFKNYEGYNCWCDHTISPHYFYHIAKENNLTYDSESMGLVIEMFLSEALEDDVTFLHHHLPK